MKIKKVFKKFFFSFFAFFYKKVNKNLFLSLYFPKKRYFLNLPWISLPPSDKWAKNIRRRGGEAAQTSRNKKKSPSEHASQNSDCEPKIREISYGSDNFQVVIRVVSGAANCRQAARGRGFINALCPPVGCCTHGRVANARGRRSTPPNGSVGSRTPMGYWLQKISSISMNGSDSIPH